MQRKVAATTRAMADAKRQLLELETGRHEAELRELATAGEAVARHSSEAQVRADSENITREVIGRLLTQPSPAPAK
jgi:hypothetical protein